MPSRSLDSKHTGAGISREQETEIGIDACLVGQSLLRNEVEPVVRQSRTELLATIAGGEFDVEARG